MALNRRRIEAALASSLMRSDVIACLKPELAIAVLATIQLASRHPAFPHTQTTQNAEGFARALQALLTHRDPDLGPLLEAGWSAALDETITNPTPPRSADGLGDGSADRRA